MSYIANSGNFVGNVTGNADTATNAGALDNLDSTQFLRSDASDSTSGTSITTFHKLGFNGVGTNSNTTSGNGYHFYQEAGAWTSPFPDLIMGYHTGVKFGGHKSYGGIRFYNDHPYNSSATKIMSVGEGTNDVRIQVGNLYFSSSTSNKAWHAGNDGSGSGLDADTVDGVHASSLYGVTSVATGGGLTGGTITSTGTISHADTSSVSNVNNSGNTFIQDITFDTYGHVTGVTSATATGGGGGGSFNGGTVTGNTFFNTSNMKVGIRTGNPSAALDVNGTIKAESLNVNDKLLMVAQPVSSDEGYVQSDAYGHGGHFGHYVEDGVVASDGNSYTIGDVNSVPTYTAAFGRFGKVVEDIRVATFRLTYPSYNWLYSFPKQLVEVPYFNTQIKPMLQILGASVFVDMLNGQSGGAGLSGNKIDIFQIGYWRGQHNMGSQSTDTFNTFKPVLRFPKGVYNANLRDNVTLGANATPANFYYCEMERDAVNGGVAYPDHHIFLSSNTHDWGVNSSNQNNLVFTIKLRYKLIHPSGDFSQSIATTFGGG